MRIVKKYANRKLYDTIDKKYVAMDALAELIKNGEEITVIDNKTGEDITAFVVSQILAREKKEGGEDEASGVLIEVLRRGSGTIKGYAKKYFALWQGALHMAEEETDKLVNYLVKGKKISESEGERLKEEIISRSENMKSWLRSNIDKRVNEALAKMNLASREQIGKLSGLIDELSQKVESLERTLMEKEHEQSYDSLHSESKAIGGEADASETASFNEGN